ncbi:hypothetical protein EYZ11_010043 [Aspergillus tanneri]|uniref:Efficient mitochondria targeting-associated protein 19 n=1 Tax=Aspergillus tanneri TaxID=1220188 RepID=A0A4S3J8H5_9EURO|nr:uncharacterized protein ATNIH1004_005557 [Aspergillus tanneri]KAA8646882.1 hypothetical protein ATNIH1004_005557 [Aspergillus tanneri]THC90497.1 hypothetical protein EYZ11_010043 [Aspergillus tanneri]
MANLTSSSPVSLWRRKRDLIYFVFFVIHIPIVFLVDTVHFLPSFLTFQFSYDVRDYYFTTYQDKFFEDGTPGWFIFFNLMELYYHGPLSIWAVWALWKDHPMVPVHLLIFGLQTFITTIVCLIEMMGWEDRTASQKQNLLSLWIDDVGYDSQITA